MASESQSQKKGLLGAIGGLGDFSGLLLIPPKERIDLDKEPPSWEHRFQVPDFWLVLRVSIPDPSFCLAYINVRN